LDTLMPRPSAAPSPSRWRLPDAGRKCVRLSTRERRIKSDSRLGNLIERKISIVILPKIELWLVSVQIGRKGITVLAHVRFGSLAHIKTLPVDVRFVQEADTLVRLHRSPRGRCKQA